MKWIAEGYELRPCRDRAGVESSEEGADQFTELPSGAAMGAALHELERLQGGIKAADAMLRRVRAEIDEQSKVIYDRVMKIAVLEQTKRTLLAQNGRQAEDIQRLDKRLGLPPRGRRVVDIDGGLVLADDGTMWEWWRDPLSEEWKWGERPPIPQPEPGDAGDENDIPVGEGKP